MLVYHSILTHMNSSESNSSFKCISIFNKLSLVSHSASARSPPSLGTFNFSIFIFYDIFLIANSARFSNQALFLQLLIVLSAHIVHGMHDILTLAQCPTVYIILHWQTFLHYSKIKRNLFHYMSSSVFTERLFHSHCRHLRFISLLYGTYIRFASYF